MPFPEGSDFPTVLRSLEIRGSPDSIYAKSGAWCERAKKFANLQKFLLR